jgi:hypothetical protein
MSVEATSSQDLIQLIFKGGTLMLDVSKFGVAAPFKVAAYLQAKLDRASQNKKSGKIDMSSIGGDGQPISCFMLRYEDFLAVKDEAKRYGLKYGVIIDMDKPQPDDEVALFINQNDAVKLERILDSLKLAALEPNLGKVKVEDENSQVIKAEVELKKKTETTESARESKQEAKEESDPLAASPFVEKLLKNEKNPSVRKEIDRIAAEMEAEEKKQYGKRKSGKSSNEAYIKTKTKKK